jgi:hypothetical protein
MGGIFQMRATFLASALQIFDFVHGYPFHQIALIPLPVNRKPLELILLVM